MKQSTPVSITKSLSELRLAHARLAEEHVSSVALLRRREKELADAQTRITEDEHTIGELKTELELVKGKAGRQEARAQLAERDVGYLKAMVVWYSDFFQVRGL